MRFPLYAIAVFAAADAAARHYPDRPDAGESAGDRRHPARRRLGPGNPGTNSSVYYNSSHRHFGAHRHGNRAVNGSTDGRAENLMLVQAGTGAQYNPYSKHAQGRHVCTKTAEKPAKTRQTYCKPIYKNYVIRCQGNQICKGVRLVYETHYKDVPTKLSNERIFACCPGWTQTTNRSHGCNKASCSKPCLNGGKCIKPEMCACLKGFAGQQCELTIPTPVCHKPCLNNGKCIKKDTCSCPKDFDGPQCENDLKIPRCSRACENGGECVQHETCRCPAGFEGRFCERDVDECREQKPCDQICYNTPGSYTCQCKEDFALQKDGQTCRKEDDGSDGGIEAKDLEFEMLDKRLLKLETMMDESHKNDVSQDDLRNVYKDIDIISEDMRDLKNKIIDVENYKNDMHVFKTKLNTIEKKAEKVDDLVVKYDRMKKCAFYNKICM
ncbi:unnamed protein product [Phyllotreta striolata]|uniref:Uncharacterized protein n=1 Tax=Phyllotreta striolata TaxID=444603 RepID=A0A9N9TIT9_PHYSR|nr:unnamed protein product [Phyllotreta striolata]